MALGPLSAYWPAQSVQRTGDVTIPAPPPTRNAGEAIIDAGIAPDAHRQDSTQIRCQRDGKTLAGLVESASALHLERETEILAFAVHDAARGDAVHGREVH